jgi:hypothetical protein
MTAASEACAALGVGAVEEDAPTVRPAAQLARGAHPEQDDVHRCDLPNDGPDETPVARPGAGRLGDRHAGQVAGRAQERVPVQHDRSGEERAETRCHRRLARPRWGEHVPDHAGKPGPPPPDDGRSGRPVPRYRGAVPPAAPVLAAVPPARC